MDTRQFVRRRVHDAYWSHDWNCAVTTLRPEGFSPDNPPHLCENLTRRAILFDIRCIDDALTGREERGTAEG